MNAEGSARVIEHVGDASHTVALAAPRPPWESVLLADPAHFDVRYVINPHMAGNVGTIDHEHARAQWARLVQVYQRLGYPVHVVPPVPDFPDLVFAANPSFPVLSPDGSPAVVLSRMASEHRRREVAQHERWYRAHGVTTFQLPGSACFEGKGDARWHPGRALIYGGYGFRTEREAYDALAELLRVPVIALRLVDPRFYHLDTCLAPLTERAALVVEEAFDDQGLALLRACFSELLPVPYDEAMRFACNGNAPDGRHYVLQAGNPKTCDQVRRAGLEPIEIDTSEFLKSGGSVFCMTMMLPFSL